MSLRAGIAAFIASGGDRTEMLIPLWATTYNVSPDSVREEWERQMTARSTQPQNKYEEPEGK